VQGSEIGPAMHLLMEKDLHLQSVQNLILKFADDANLLVAQHSDPSIVESINVQNWASEE
jgi:hypothetical protein